MDTDGPGHFRSESGADLHQKWMKRTVKLAEALFLGFHAAWPIPLCISTSMARGRAML